MRPHDRLDRPDRTLGAVVLRLLLTTDHWIHRRVETVRFVSDQCVRREVSIDAEPGRVVEWTGGHRGTLPVPLTLLAKELMVDFDIRDEVGAAIPVFTRRQNAVLAWSVLVVACETVLDQPLTSLLRRELRMLVAADVAEAQAARERLLKGPHPEGVAPEVAALRESPQFPLLHALLTNLAGNFLLTVPLELRPPRRIITFSYQETLDERRPALPVHPSNLGWVPVLYLFDAPAVADAGSYHLEIHLPEGIRAWDPRLYVHAEPPPPRVPPVKSRVSGSVARLYISELLPGTSAGGCARLGVAPAPDGIVRRALLSAVFTLAVLGLVSAVEATGVLAGVGDVAPVVLLIAASSLPTYLARPTEHVLVSRLLYGVRAMVVLSVLLLFAAAVTLAFGLGVPLWLLAAAQAGATTVLLVTWAVARRALIRVPEEGSVRLVPDQARFLRRCQPRAHVRWWRQVYTGRSVEGQRAVQPGASSWDEVRAPRSALLDDLERQHDGPRRSATGDGGSSQPALRPR